jgi:hypothetical protein
MKRALIVMTVVVLTLTVAGGVPAFGGPSPLAVAKKALRIAAGTKKELKRSYNRTHPTEVVHVDGGQKFAQPIGFAEWDISCPRGTVVVGTSIGYGALEPVSDLSYDSGVLVSLANPSTTQAFSGTVEVHCVWALGSSASAATTARKKRALWEKVRHHERLKMQAR